MKDDPAYIERLKLAALRVSPGSQQGWQDLLRLLEEHEARTDALKYLLSVSPCQNNCKPNDYSCATRRAQAALKSVNKFRPKPLYGRKPR